MISTIKIEAVPGEYASYYANYIKYISPGSLRHIFHSDQEEINSLFSILDDKTSLTKYEEDKWTVKEVLVHCIDTERLFCARALKIARGEKESLPGYDHDLYVKNSGANERSLQSIAHEWQLLRKSTLSLFETFTEEALLRQGIANNKKVSVRAIPFIITGHVMHHLHIIRDRYGLDF